MLRITQPPYLHQFFGGGFPGGGDFVDFGGYGFNVALHGFGFFAVGINCGVCHAVFELGFFCFEFGDFCFETGNFFFDFEALGFDALLVFPGELGGGG